MKKPPAKSDWKTKQDLMKKIAPKGKESAARNGKPVQNGFYTPFDPSDANKIVDTSLWLLFSDINVSAEMHPIRAEREALTPERILAFWKKDAPPTFAVTEATLFNPFQDALDVFVARARKPGGRHLPREETAEEKQAWQAVYAFLQKHLERSPAPPLHYRNQDKSRGNDTLAMDVDYLCYTVIPEVVEAAMLKRMEATPTSRLPS